MDTNDDIVYGAKAPEPLVEAALISSRKRAYQVLEEDKENWLKSYEVEKEKRDDEQWFVEPPDVVELQRAYDAERARLELWLDQIQEVVDAEQQTQGAVEESDSNEYSMELPSDEDEEIQSTNLTIDSA